MTASAIMTIFGIGGALEIIKLPGKGDLAIKVNLATESSSVLKFAALTIGALIILTLDSLAHMPSP